MKEDDKEKTGQSKRTVAGVGEKLQYFVHELNDNTVRFALRYPCRISPELMERAVLMTVKGADVLHSSFEAGKRNAFWIINDEVSAEECFECLCVKDDIEHAMQKAMVKRVAAEAIAQLFCTLLLGEKESILVLTISHLCADGSDGRYLLMKLLEAYRLLAENKSTKAFQVKNGNRSPFQVYEKLSRKEYFSAMMPRLSKVKSKFPFPQEGEGSSQIVMHSISSDVMENARSYGKKYHATVNDLLLTACYKAYAELPGIDPDSAMSILSMMDLRHHCIGEESKGLCNMSGPLSTELKNGAAAQFDVLLREISAQTQAEKDNPISGLHGMPVLHTITKMIPFGLLLNVAKKVYGSFTIGMTNLGNFNGKALEIEGHEPDGCTFAGPLKKKPGMQISAVGLNGEITLCCIGEYTGEDVKLIRQMLERMEQELTAFSDRYLIADDGFQL